MNKFVLILAALLSLQGCIFAVGAAAGAITAVIVYDHRKIGASVDDRIVNNNVIVRIKNDAELHKNSHIVATTFNKTVLLVGETNSEENRQAAETIARTTPRVEQVYNDIQIKGTASALTRTSDSWITTKIRTQMLANNDLSSGDIKIVTENGSVYLMGKVTNEQAAIAVDIARKVSGVQRVIKIFQIIPTPPA